MEDGYAKAVEIHKQRHFAISEIHQQGPRGSSVVEILPDCKPVLDTMCQLPSKLFLLLSDT